MKPPLNDEEKRQIETLSAAGWSPHRIGKHLKRSPHTIVKHLSQPGIAAKVQDEKTVLAEKYRAMARKALDSISDGDLLKSSALQKATISGICTDKALVLTGETPSIDVHILLEAVAAVREMRRTATPQLPSNTDPEP
jgi:hypothetical protein